MKTRMTLCIICFNLLMILGLSYKSLGQCNAKYAALPYIQDFESSWINFCGVNDVPDSSWLNSYPNNLIDDSIAAWRRDDFSLWDGNINGDWYSPAAVHGNYSARFKTAFTVDTGTNYTSTGNLDLHLNLSSMTGLKVLSFYYINKAGSDIMDVYLSSDSGSTFTTLGHYTTTSGWIMYLLPINSNSSKAIIRFTGTSIEGANGSDDIGLDYVQVKAALDYNVSIITQNIATYPIQNYITGNLQNINYVQNNSNNIISGELINYGAQTINTMNLNWSVNGGPINTTSLTSLSIQPFSYYNYNSVVSWKVTSEDTQTLKIWADSINGNPDENPSIDTLTTSFVVVDTLVKKIAMIEEFGNASCDPCAIAIPNLDSVYQNSKAFCNIVRYHVDFPGEDFMNSETQSQVAVRQGYYDVTGVPNGFLDGQINFAPASIATPIIYAESFPKIPMKITGSYTYDVSTHIHTVNATVKTFTDFPSGLNIYAIITDSLGYSKNQSQESIPQYYFPEVAEEILPTAQGDALGQFQNNSSQTVNYTWDQTRPLAANYNSFPYDSGNFAVVIFVQNTGTDEVYQSIKIPATEINTGIKTMNSYLSDVEISPNPTTNNIGVMMQLNKNEHIVVKLNDILGRELFSYDEGILIAGNHNFTYESSRIPAGMYFLTFEGEDGNITLKVVKN